MNRFRKLLGASVLFATIQAQPAIAGLLGIDNDSGNLYSISETTAARTLIGNTGVTGWADIQFAPNGTLYGFTSSAAPTPSLYIINPTTAAVTLVGPLNLGFVFEGALTFDPDDGTAYGMNTSSAANAGIFTINLSTGSGTSIGSIGAADINGFTYISPGTFIALDRVSNSLLSIDATTLALSSLASVPTTVGGVGGLTNDGGIGFYATSGPGGSEPGSNTLYSFNLSTGASTPIGNLGFTGTGLSGLAATPAAVPEPGSLALLGLGLAGIIGWRRRKLN